MGLELPLVSAVMARLVDPDVNLAAYGGLVFPVALIVEAPIIMLLAASTALAKDYASYLKMHRFMMVAGGLLTALHALLAFTPLFDWVLVPLFNPPADVVEPARLGLQIMLPWTWTIAYRRFHQGLLIRYGASRAVGVGTGIRLLTVSSVALFGLAIGSVQGVVVATVAIASGVTAEALYTGLRTRRLVQGPLRNETPVDPELSWAAFGRFYVPLALTSLLLLLVQPVGAAGIGRMPAALASLAAWPVVNGIVFLLRSVGYAYNEVVVALMDEPDAQPMLKRFAWLMAAVVAAVAFTVAATPLSTWWFETVSGLRPELADLARRAFWVGMLWGPIDVFRNYVQGQLVFERETRAISESVGLFLVVSAILMGLGVWLEPTDGLVVAMVAFLVGSLVQLAWLQVRLRGVRAKRAATAYTGGSA